MNPDRALFIGRFQPFHNGHLGVVTDLLESHDEVIIAIGSTDACYSLHDPFTCRERFDMIEAVLRNRGLKERTITTIVPDISSNALWPNYLNEITPEFTVVYSNNPLVKTVFFDKGFDVETIPFNRDRVSGSIIRNDILLGNPMWMDFVPEEVVEFVLQRNIHMRLQDVSAND